MEQYFDMPPLTDDEIAELVKLLNCGTDEYVKIGQNVIVCGDFIGVLIKETTRDGRYSLSIYTHEREHLPIKRWDWEVYRNELWGTPQVLKDMRKAERLMLSKRRSRLSPTRTNK